MKSHKRKEENQSMRLNKALTKRLEDYYLITKDEDDEFEEDSNHKLIRTTEMRLA